VTGIFTYGMAQMDETRSFASLATVQKMLQQNPSYVTDLNIKLKDHQLAKEVARQLEQRFGIFTEDWQTANAPLLAGDSIRNTMTAVISFTLLLVAGFGIYNIMNMSIMNKMKDIAILKATGFQGKDIVAIFMLQSVIIGVLGGVLGVTAGFGFCSLLSITPFPQGDFFRTPTMPVNFDPMFYVFGVLFGFLTTLFAGYFPALKASKVDPVAIIRG
jgi:lipoprotein-releasing system permease protein